MLKIRTIPIDLSGDHVSGEIVKFGGFDGEHNATRLDITLPQRLIDENADYYNIDFSTSLGELIPSIPCTLTNGHIIYDLNQQLTVKGKLIAQVCARNGDKSLIAKSQGFILTIEASPEGNSTEASSLANDAIWVEYLENATMFLENIPDNIIVPLNSTGAAKSNAGEGYAREFYAKLMKCNTQVTSSVTYSVVKDPTNASFTISVSSTGYVSFALLSSSIIPSGTCGHYFTVSVTYNSVTYTKKVSVEYVFDGQVGGEGGYALHVDTPCLIVPTDKDAILTTAFSKTVNLSLYTGKTLITNTALNYAVVETSGYTSPTVTKSGTSITYSWGVGAKIKDLQYMDVSLADMNTSYEAPYSLPVIALKPGIIQVDSALSSTSENPLQNKVINTILIEKTSYGVVSGLAVIPLYGMSVYTTNGVIYMSNGARYTPAGITSQQINAADATKPRIDIFYVSSAGITTYLAGTAAASPVQPSVPSGGQLIYVINVPANITEITSTMIVNKQKMLYTEPDAVLSATSENTVQNKVVKTAIDATNTTITEKTSYGVVSGLSTHPLADTNNWYISVVSGVIYMQNGTRYPLESVLAQKINAADTTNPRKDIMYVSSAGVVTYLAGTAAASPVAPSVPSGGQILSEIFVAANATTITSANITNKYKILYTDSQLTAMFAALDQRIAALETV